MLQVHLSDTSGESETTRRGMYAYRDANEEIVAPMQCGINSHTRRQTGKSH